MTVQVLPSAAVMSRVMSRWMDLTTLRVTFFGIIIVFSSVTRPSSATAVLTPTPVTITTLSSISTPPPSTISTSTLSPTPTPSPPPFRYQVTADNNNETVCILMNATITITMNYTQKDGSNGEATFLLDHTAEVDANLSHCGSGKDSNMTILWHSNTSHVSQYLTFFFKRERYQWKMSNVDLTINVTEADFNNPDTTGQLFFQSNKTAFLNEYQRSYKCKSLSISLEVNSTNATINSTTVVLRDLRVQAFEFRRNGEFGNARECPEFQKKNLILPIAVGSLLVLLLTAVIVVYILSRFRRRQLMSYESLN